MANIKIELISYYKRKYKFNKNKPSKNLLNPRIRSKINFIFQHLRKKSQFKNLELYITPEKICLFPAKRYKTFSKSQKVLIKVLNGVQLYQNLEDLLEI